MKNVISVNPEILGGTPVFAGTRVPTESFFDHLGDGVSLDEFLDDFPSVTREQAVDVLNLAEGVLTSTNCKAIYEAVAC